MVNWKLTCAIAPVLVFLASPVAGAAPAAASATPPFIRPKTTCPTELQPLSQMLLRDLPSYLNRQSHQRGGSQSGRYALMASQPDFRPLPVITKYPSPEAGGLYQVFFTLLERQYETRRFVDYQTHHWLFLAQSETEGWTLAILYSRGGPYPVNSQFPSALQDATRLATGRAIRQWLQDCAAGAIRPLQNGDRDGAEGDAIAPK